MQISAQTLLASQQTSVSQQTGPVQPRPAPAFAAALEKSEGFAPLLLKQAAPAQQSAAAQPAPAGPARLGAMIDIKV